MACVWPPVSKFCGSAPGALHISRNFNNKVCDNVMSNKMKFAKRNTLTVTMNYSRNLACKLLIMQFLLDPKARLPSVV